MQMVMLAMVGTMRMLRYACWTGGGDNEMLWRWPGLPICKASELLDDPLVWRCYCVPGKMP